VSYARKTTLLALLLLMAVAALAQTHLQTTDVLGAHDFSSTASPLHGPNANACSYCHIPHRGLSSTPLWNQTLSTQPYTTYTSPTSQNVGTQPALGKTSVLCLSCHDGTVAVGQTVAIGTLKMTGTNTSIIGTKLEGSHPFSLQLPIKDAAHLVPELVGSQTTTDATKAVHLVDGNIECNTCHNVHIQSIDKKAPKFLVRDNAGGKLCLSCHGVTPRTVANRDNTLALWPMSVHAKSTAQVALKAGLGEYANMSDFACSSCHISHNAAGGELLRKSATALPNIDTTSQNCLTCHDGSDNLVQPIANVLADFQKLGHPFADANNLHTDAEPGVLNRNRHTTCADCHHPHASLQTTTFGAAPDIRPSQNGVIGVAADGTTVTTATRQYENCLRCHGNSTEKQALATFGYLPARLVFGGDQLNLINQLGNSAVSAHPVMKDSTLGSQPSLLTAMWDLSGTTKTRPMGTRILCTDCHNSDNNREFGGTGPNGPHGSKNTHILERRYEFSQVAAGVYPAGGPGTTIINPIKSPPVDPGSNGPYSLCAKCHDLNNVLSDVSWNQHGKHVRDQGISCSVCHSAHGVPAGGSGAGKRLVNFDVNVVAPNAGVLTYNNNSCTLTCHMMKHNPDGTIVPASPTDPLAVTATPSAR
jgi:predicted CXXCH cytochrome family protein